MFSSMFCQVGIAAIFPGLHHLLSPEFWSRIYATGQIGAEGEPNLLLVILSRVIVAIAVLFAARVLVGIVRRIIAHGISTAMTRSGHAQRRLITLQGLLTSAVTYAIYLVTIVLVLLIFGLTWKGLAPFFVAASILPLAIGFGAQRLVRDVITGLFILGEGQFDVGEMVTIGSVTGRVEDMGLRVTRLRDDQGRLYIIANGDITQVFNASRGPIKLSVDLLLKPSQPINETIAAILQAADETLKEHHITPSENQTPQVLVTGMLAEKTTVRLVLWVPVHEKAAVEDAIRRKLLQTAAIKDSKFAFAIE